jgi:hypothetical protein
VTDSGTRQPIAGAAVDLGPGVQQPPPAPRAGLGIPSLLLAAILGGVFGGVLGIVWSQNRCYGRYRRLCSRWFAGDPGGELGCLERADDVCFPH